MLNDLKTCVKKELEDVLLLMEKASHSKIDLVKTIQQYILNQPEKKMVRPLVLLLFAKALKYEGEAHIVLSAIIEMIHGATLLHDDIIDQANTRRNKPTSHVKFGTTQSVLMGDFIYASAFQLIAQLNDPAITTQLAAATKEIVEGEILQLSLQGKHTLSSQDYMKIIRAKTALLFSTGIQCIAKIANAPSQLADYGYHFGMLYQITDDILDIDISNTLLNKAHGTDLKEGKMTLPIILAYHSSLSKDQQLIRKILSQQSDWENIVPILEKTNALAKCQPYLHYHVQKGKLALQGLENSQHKTHLLHLLENIPYRKR